MTSGTCTVKGSKFRLWEWHYGEQLHFSHNGTADQIHRLGIAAWMVAAEVKTLSDERLWWNGCNAAMILTMKRWYRHSLTAHLVLLSSAGIKTNAAIYSLLSGLMRLFPWAPTEYVTFSSSLFCEGKSLNGSMNISIQQRQTESLP